MASARLHGVAALVVATLLVTLGMTSPATAVDLSGDYVVTVPYACRLTDVQTGTAVQVSGSCSGYPVSLAGTVDPGTGAFSVTGAIPGLCADLACSGTGDGEETHSTCTSSTAACNGPVLATKCGNGVIDPLENCDPTVGGDPACCSARCRLEPAGSVCATDAIDLCAGLCDAAGTCTHVLVPPMKCRRAVVSRDVERCMATQCAGVGRAACRRRCKPAAIRTLAYALSECQVDAAGRFSGREVLRALRGNQEPITLVDFGSSGEPVQDQVARTFCTMRGGQRGYLPSVPAFPLQRLGVSPDGSVVVFEVNQEFAIFAPPPSARLSAEEQGFFSIHADGRGLRRLGPPSHDPSFRIDIYPPAFPGEITGVAFPTPISFSPNGRRIAFTDRGPGVGGEDAIQVVVLDLATGRRTQVTHLPSGTPPRVVFGEFFLTCCPRFIDDETVVFQTFVDPDGSNPEHNLAAFTVRIDGTHFKDVPQPVVLEGSGVVPTFGVVGRHTGLLRLPLPGKPEGPPTAKPTNFPITDVFLRDGKNLTQLTDFHRADTFPAFLNADQTRAFFLAAADPVKTNPSKSCQMFSINTLGRGLRQVTHFKGDPPVLGCFAECCTGGIGYGWYRVIIQDPVTKAVIFESTYDPLGANRHGGQVFAMRPNGTGLRQLTDASGFTTNSDGSFRVELPGPFAYSATVH